jgi:hypothetical protein
MSEAKHTNGRLKVSYKKFSQLLADNGALVATCHNLDGLVNLQANAARLAACWNACEGIEMHELELMTGNLSIEKQLKFKPEKAGRKSKYRTQRDNLLAALSGVLMINRGASGRIIIGDLDEKAIRDAIAKATGENNG